MLYTERAMGVKCEQSQIRILYVRELSVFSESQKRTISYQSYLLVVTVKLPPSHILSQKERLIGRGKGRVLYERVLKKKVPDWKPAKLTIKHHLTTK